MTDVLIIGGGPAGLTAAIYSVRAGLTATVIENNVYGGQMASTPEIENYPGFEKIDGAELSSKMHEQTSKLGANFIFDEIESVNLTNEIKTVKTSSEELYAKTVIIANGLKRRNLNIPGEKKFTGLGVSFCAVCDGSFQKNKNVVVVGGGNTALEDALYLAKICKKVTMIIRKNHFRGEKFLVDIVNKTPNIEVLFEKNLKEIIGAKFVTGVILDNGEKLDTSGVFIAVGHIPQNDLFKGQVEFDENGFFISDENCKTNLPGIFVAGDCRKKLLNQIVTATADGAIASRQAFNFIMAKQSASNEELHPMSPVHANSNFVKVGA